MSNFFNFLCCLGKRDKHSKALGFLEENPNKIEQGPFIGGEVGEFDEILARNNDSSRQYFESHPDLFGEGKGHEEEKVQSQSTLSTQPLKKPGKAKRVSRAWTLDEDNLLKKYYKLSGGKWKEIEKYVPNRTMTQCCQRWRRIKPFKTRKPWDCSEDQLVLQMVSESGPNWQLIAKKMNGRTGKQVRDRYINILDPSISREAWTEEEDRILYESFLTIGPFWSEISKGLQGRPENMVKNRFYSHIKKKMGIAGDDPSERNTDQQSMFEGCGHSDSMGNFETYEYMSNTSHIYDNEQIVTGKSMLMDIEDAMEEGLQINEEAEDEPNPFLETNKFDHDFWRDDNNVIEEDNFLQGP